jgi:hypothetical protein
VVHSILAQVAAGTRLDLSQPLDLTIAISPDLVLTAGAMIMLLFAAWRPESEAHQRRVALGSMGVALLTLVAVIAVGLSGWSSGPDLSRSMDSVGRLTSCSFWRRSSRSACRWTQTREKESRPPRRTCWVVRDRGHDDHGGRARPHGALPWLETMSVSGTCSLA